VGKLSNPKIPFKAISQGQRERVVDLITIVSIPKSFCTLVISDLLHSSQINDRRKVLKVFFVRYGGRNCGKDGQGGRSLAMSGLPVDHQVQNSAVGTHRVTSCAVPRV
jgi:hypothetical protein